MSILINATWLLCDDKLTNFRNYSETWISCASPLLNLPPHRFLKNSKLLISRCLKLLIFNIHQVLNATHFLFIQEELLRCFQCLNCVLVRRFFYFFIKNLLWWNLTFIYVVAELCKWYRRLIFLLKMLNLRKSLSLIWTKSFNKVLIIFSRFWLIHVLTSVNLLLISIGLLRIEYTKVMKILINGVINCLF
jgi:hypothetical protein